MTEFESAVMPLVPELKAYCCRLCGSKWDADDLIQETLVRAYAYWVNRGTAAVERPFLYRTARNVWIDECRRYRRRMTPVDQTCMKHGSAPNGFGLPIRSVLDEAAGKLSERQFEIVLLAELYGYSMEEIAGLTHSSVSGVKSALHRARKQLRGEIRAAIRDRDQPTEQTLEEWARRIFNEFIEGRAGTPGAGPAAAGEA